MHRSAIGTASRRRSLLAMLSSPLLLLARPAARAVSASDEARGEASGQGQPAPAPKRVFGSDAGMILNAIKPDHAADFELVMGKVKEALQRSDKPERRQQGQGWRVFKAKEAGVNNSVLYVFWVNPAAKDADYTVSAILSEAFPARCRNSTRSSATRSPADNPREPRVGVQHGPAGLTHRHGPEGSSCQTLGTAARVTVRRNVSVSALRRAHLTPLSVAAPMPAAVRAQGVLHADSTQ